MTLQNIFWHFPLTRGLDIVRLYISSPYGVIIREFDFDSRKSWWENFKNANFSDAFLNEYSKVIDFEFLIENESVVVLEIQVQEVNND